MGEGMKQVAITIWMLLNFVRCHHKEVQQQQQTQQRPSTPNPIVTIHVGEILSRILDKLPEGPQQDYVIMMSTRVASNQLVQTAVDILGMKSIKVALGKRDVDSSSEDILKRAEEYTGLMLRLDKPQCIPRLFCYIVAQENLGLGGTNESKFRKAVVKRFGATTRINPEPMTPLKYLIIAAKLGRTATVPDQCSKLGPNCKTTMDRLIDMADLAYLIQDL